MSSIAGNFCSKSDKEGWRCKRCSDRAGFVGGARCWLSAGVVDEGEEDDTGCFDARRRAGLGGGGGLVDVERVGMMGGEGDAWGGGADVAIGGGVDDNKGDTPLDTFSSIFPVLLGVLGRSTLIFNRCSRASISDATPFLNFKSSSSCPVVVAVATFGVDTALLLFSLRVDDSEALLTDRLWWPPFSSFFVGRKSDSNASMLFLALLLFWSSLPVNWFFACIPKASSMSVSLTVSFACEGLKGSNWLMFCDGVFECRLGRPRRMGVISGSWCGWGGSFSKMAEGESDALLVAVVTVCCTGELRDDTVGWEVYEGVSW